MEILNYFEAPDRACWRAEILKSPWRAAAFLVQKVDEGAFFDTFGPGGRILLLVDGGALASFCTFAPRDEVLDPALTPWVGFAYTFEAYRGRRCLGLLLDRACALAAAEGHDALYLSTDHVGLYEKYGFAYYGDRPTVWGEDARVYRRFTQ